MEFALDYIMKNVDYFQSRLSEGVFRDGIHIFFISSINQWNRDSIDGILKTLDYKLSKEKGKNQNRGTIEQRRKKCRNQMIFLIHCTFILPSFIFLLCGKTAADMTLCLVII